MCCQTKSALNCNATHEQAFYKSIPGTWAAAHPTNCTFKYTQTLLGLYMHSGKQRRCVTFSDAYFNL